MSGRNDVIPERYLHYDMWDAFLAWAWSTHIPWTELKRLLFDWERIVGTKLTGEQVQFALKGNWDNGP